MTNIIAINFYKKDEYQTYGLIVHKLLCILMPFINNPTHIEIINLIERSLHSEEFFNKLYYKFLILKKDSKGYKNYTFDKLIYSAIILLLLYKEKPNTVTKSDKKLMDKLQGTFIADLVVLIFEKIMSSTGNCEEKFDKLYGDCRMMLCSLKYKPLDLI